MTQFTCGEKVIIRFGKEKGKKGTILQTQPADGYKVKVEGGSILFFSGKGLEKEK